MPTKKKTNAAPPSVTPLVQAEAATMAEWLSRAGKRRSQHFLKDRLEALLWSWPIRLDFSTRPPNLLWACVGDNKEIRQRKATILARLTSLAETWYSDAVYPVTIYSDTWAPYDGPSTMDHADFEDLCRDLCKGLRTLPGITVPDPQNDRPWLTALLEHGWGDGHLSARRDYQNMVVNGLPQTVRRRICEIGERAWDAAYRDVRINRCLDALHHTKASAQAFRNWLQDAKTHAPFVEEHLTERFSTEFHRTMERMTRALDFYMNNAAQGRSRRAIAGRQRRPWVVRAKHDLKVPELHRRDLLIAWSLTPFPRAR